MNAPHITTDPTLPLPGWQSNNPRPAMEPAECASPRVAEFDPRGRGPVFLRKYVGGTLMTMGEYPSAQSAMLASDEGVWIQLGSNGWRSQDGRTIIEEPRT